jgi:hypothetical protein
VVYYIRRAKVQYGEFQAAEQFPVRFDASPEEVIEAVLALKPRRSMAENLGNMEKGKAFSASRTHAKSYKCEAMNFSSVKCRAEPPTGIDDD